jgi:hypothetical protein
MKITKFQQYSLQDSMVSDFINSFDGLITESDESEYKKIQKRVLSDLRLNGNLSLTFGAGIQALYPVVNKLMTNMKISSIEVTADKVILLTICAFTIVYLEEKKFKDGKEENILTKDYKSMLEELKMKGIGNGIVRKVVKLFNLITDIFNLIGKHLNSVVKGFVDMFAYTAILIPIMNGIFYIVGKYNLNVDTFLENFAALTMGVGTLIAKNGIISIIDKLKDKISPKDKEEIVDEIDTTVIKKVSDFTLKPEDGEMINEQ